MAEEIEYRPKIDTSDLAAQLQEVRNQINNAVSQQTFSTSIPGPQPQAFAFPLDNAMGMARADVQNFGQSFQNASANSLSAAQNTVNSARLGFQKFVNDAQNNMLTSGYKNPFSNTDTSFPQFNPNDYLKNAMASSWGYGYKPSMSITPGAYMERAAEAKAEGAWSRDLTWGTGIGAGAAVGLGTIAMGVGTGGVGFAVVGAVATGTMLGEFASDATEAVLARDYASGKNIRNYARETSWRFLSGKMDREKLGQIGMEAASLARAESTQGYDLTRGDVERVTKEYTEIGGFDLVRSAEEYRSKLKGVIEGHRKVMQVFKMSEQDALAAMKELNQYGVDPATNATGIAAMAYASGYTAKEFMQFAGQSAEMVRGTGMNMGAAYMGGMTTLAAMKFGLQENIISNNLAAQNGGIENMAASTQRAGYAWANSMSGFTQMAADVAMGGINKAAGLNTVETLGAAVGLLTSGGISGILKYQGSNPERISQYTPGALATNEAVQWAKMVMDLPGIGAENFDQATYRAVLQQSGISITEADNKWAQMKLTQDINRQGSGYYEKIYKDASTIAIRSVPTTYDILTDKISGAISGFFDSASGSLMGKDDAAFKEHQAATFHDSYGTLKLSSAGKLEQADGFSSAAIAAERAKLKGAGRASSEFDAKVSLAKDNAKRLTSAAQGENANFGSRLRSYLMTNGEDLSKMFGAKGSKDEKDSIVGEQFSTLSDSDLRIKSAEYAKKLGINQETFSDHIMSIRKSETESGRLGEVKRANELAKKQTALAGVGELVHDDPKYYENLVSKQNKNEFINDVRWAAGLSSDGSVSGLVGAGLRIATNPFWLGAAFLKHGYKAIASSSQEQVLKMQEDEKAKAAEALEPLRRDQAQRTDVMKALGQVDFSGKMMGAASGTGADQAMAEINARLAAQNTATATKGIWDIMRNGGKMQSDPKGTN